MLPHAAPGGYDVSSRTVDVQNRLTAVVGKALTDKGYVSVPDHGDLIIVVAAGETTTEQTRQLTTRAAAVAGDRDETIIVPEGSLIIEAWDPAKHERVWRSAATGEVRSEGVDEIDSTASLGRCSSLSPQPLGVDMRRALLVLAGALVACGGGSERRFPLRDPMTRDTNLASVYARCRHDPPRHDSNHVACTPKPAFASLYWDGAESGS